MVKFRPHCPLLADAMSKVKEVESIDKLIEHLENSYAIPTKINREKFKIEKYGFDERINWDTYIVFEDGYGVHGYLDKDFES